MCALSALLGFVFEAPAKADRPNILLVITHGQGHGDLGFQGNPKIRTPNLDRLARASVRLDRFSVSPDFAPKRTGLLTGWYPYRTGVADTYLGRAMMHPDEITLAEMLTASGYQTAIFGKWHFGDTTSATGRCALPAPATTQSPSGSPYPRPRARTPGASQRRPDEGRGAGRDAMHIRNRSH